MMYRPLLTITGVFALALGVILLLAPASYLSLYAAAYSPDMDFAAQRLAPAVLGLGALLFAARNLAEGPFPMTLCWVAAAVWAGVAATGVFHFATGVATANILLAAATELVLAALFARVAWQMRTN